MLNFLLSDAPALYSLCQEPVRLGYVSAKLIISIESHNRKSPLYTEDTEKWQDKRRLLQQQDVG